jgi:hypothetical protein
MSRIRLPKRGSCRRCPLRGPWGECRAAGLKSGRCGDWVWYLRGRKQCRHLYVKPKDPRTPRQLHWRARFGAASKTYSESMTQEQRDACIAAGAKLQSRRRLAQSGPLTGQQYSIRREYAAKQREGERPREPKLQAGTPHAEKCAKGLQTQANSRSTSDPLHGATRLPPEQHHRLTGRDHRSEGSHKSPESKGLKARPTSKALKPHKLTRPAGLRFRNPPRPARLQAASILVRFPRSRRASASRARA